MLYQWLHEMLKRKRKKTSYIDVSFEKKINKRAYLQSVQKHGYFCVCERSAHKQNYATYCTLCK